MDTWLNNMYGNTAPIMASGTPAYPGYSGAYGSSSGGGGGNSNPFQPFNSANPATGGATLASGLPNSAPSGSAMQNAASTWQTSNAQNQNLANNALSNAGPGFLNSLNAENSINYGNYLNSANTAGNEYQNLSGIAGNQANQYGNAAGLAGREQGDLYGAGQAIYGAAFDPNMSQYNLTANNLTGQINAGQAARGLGNSPVGGAEYNNAMSNFNTGWNTQQLQNELSGIQGMSTASNAGIGQGQMQNQDFSGQLTAGAAQPGFMMQSGMTPISAQQYAYSMPGQNSASYVSGMNSLEQPYSNLMNNDLGYLGYGSSSQLAGHNFNAGQTSAGLGGIGSVLGGLTGSGGSGLSGLGGGLSSMGGGLVSGISDLFDSGSIFGGIGDMLAAF